MNSKTKRLTVSAVMMAISAVLYAVSNFIPFLNLPFGGTITIASLLPVILISYMYGVGWGLFASATYAVMRVTISVTQGVSGAVTALFLPGSDFTVIEALLIVFLDYIAAYSVLFVAGFFRNMKSKTLAVMLGTAAAMICCYLFHTLSGAIFYGEWAEWFFTDTEFASLSISKTIMENGGAALPWIYSAIYNGCYMLPDTVISVVCAAVVSRLPQIRKLA